MLDEIVRAPLSSRATNGGIWLASCFFGRILIAGENRKQQKGERRLSQEDSGTWKVSFKGNYLTQGVPENGNPPGAKSFAY